mmetsp:Transcript_61085/g.101588  ORF Transcript_61085/g.101588 Transcript_61085/m.101588 type:complete len:94 (+) Transcript_61085:69-350(+)
MTGMGHGAFSASRVSMLGITSMSSVASICHTLLVSSFALFEQCWRPMFSHTLTLAFMQQGSCLCVMYNGSNDQGGALQFFDRVDVRLHHRGHE